MRAAWRFVSVWILSVVVGAGAIARSQAADVTESSDSSAAAQSAAAALVQQALQAEVSGNLLERAALVRRAIATDPTYAPAHWQNGEVRAKDRWLSVDDSIKELRRSGYVAQYRQKQAQAPTNYAAQSALGDWCVTNGLAAQARVHWATALLLKPNSPALISKLGMARYGKLLVPAEQLEQIRQQQQYAAESMAKWSQSLEKIQADFKADTLDKVSSAVNELDAIQDVMAVPAMETASINGGPAFAEAIVDALSGIPEQQATDALVREAISSQYSEARESAAKALQDRSLYAYVPALISILQAPIKVEFEQTYDEANTRHRLTMTQDGPLAAYEFLSANGSSVETILRMHPKRGYSELSVNPHPDSTLSQDIALARRAEVQNAAAEARNPYVMAALRIATGKNAGAKPADWWRWWLDHNEIYQYPEKQVVSTVRNYTPAYSRLRVRYSSCFVAGTKVWTMDGPIAIEQVKAGECVLAQHPATGELAYKPVVATTVRPTSPVRAIKTSRDRILATRGHPFWVSGVGWRMVKELKVGERLHSMSGPVEILGADEAGEAECYNLVVADFGNYFVGESKLLVHDNTIRDVTPALVPGLVVK